MPMTTNVADYTTTGLPPGYRTGDAVYAEPKLPVEAPTNGHPLLRCYPRECGTLYLPHWVPTPAMAVEPLRINTT